MTFKKRNEKSLRIIENLLPILEGKKNIAIYINIKDEVNTLDFLPYFLENFDVVSAPVCTEDSMEFYQINSVKNLSEGAYGILEPLPNNKIEKDEIEVMIIPMLGYDKYCDRIGYGKGYYDNYLADFKGLKVGLAFTEQHHHLVPTNEHDVSLDHVVTERGIVSRPKL